MAIKRVNLAEIRDKPKTGDVCIVGNCLSPRRQRIVDALRARNVEVEVVSGFGKARDDRLFQFKVLLNIGYADDFRVFEHIRCDRCVYNKMIVVSDLKDHMDGVYLKDFIVFEDYRGMPDRVIEILKDYRKFHAKLFAEFDLATISSKVRGLAEEAVSELRSTS